MESLCKALGIGCCIDKSIVFKGDYMHCDFKYACQGYYALLLTTFQLPDTIWAMDCRIIAIKCPTC